MTIADIFTVINALDVKPVFNIDWDLWECTYTDEHGVTITGTGKSLFASAEEFVQKIKENWR